MAQRGNHIRTEQKPSFNGKDHLKVLLIPIGTDPQPGSKRGQAVRSYIRCYHELVISVVSSV